MVHYGTGRHTVLVVNPKALVIVSLNPHLLPTLEIHSGSAVYNSDGDVLQHKQSKRKDLHPFPVPSNLSYPMAKVHTAGSRSLYIGPMDHVQPGGYTPVRPGLGTVDTWP